MKYRSLVLDQEETRANNSDMEKNKNLMIGTLPNGVIIRLIHLLKERWDTEIELTYGSILQQYSVDVIQL